MRKMNSMAIKDSNHLIEIIKEMHTDFIDSRDCINEDEVKQSIIHQVKNISKIYYKVGKDYCVKHGKNNSLYDETCIWGHIHNLNKPKVIRLLNKYKKEMSDEIDSMLFDGKQNGITCINLQKNTKKAISNEEGFRKSCETIKNMTRAFELLIELI